VAAAAEFADNREAVEVLCHCLSLPLWTPQDLQQHWQVRPSSPDFAACEELLGRQTLPERQREVSAHLHASLAA
jgi:hypothetical protein